MGFDYFVFYTEASLICVIILSTILLTDRMYNTKQEKNVSIGYDLIRGSDDDANECLKRADKNLYIDKQRKTEQNDGRYQYDFQQLESWNTYYIYGS